MVKGFSCVSCLLKRIKKGYNVQNVASGCILPVSVSVFKDYDNRLYEFLNWECPKCLFLYLPHFIYESNESTHSSGDNTIHLPFSDINNLEINADLKYEKLKVLHLNVRGLLRNIDEIKLLLTNNVVHIFPSSNHGWMNRYQMSKYILRAFV